MGTSVLCMAHPLMMPYLSVNIDKVCLGTFQRNQCPVHAHPLMMPYLSADINKVCFGTFQRNCRDVI